MITEQTSSEYPHHVFFTPGAATGKMSSSAIFYNTRSASSDNKGNKISPALALFHELGHAFDWYSLLIPIEMRKGLSLAYPEAIKTWEIWRKTPVENFDAGKNEYSAFQYEHQAAETLSLIGADEGKRECHECGKPYFTTSPTTTEEQK